MLAGGLLFLTIANADLGACALVETPVIALDERTIRLNDIVALDCLSAPDRERLGALSIARLPHGRERMTLHADALDNLVARRAPMLGHIETDPARRFTFQAPAQRGAASSCFAAAADIAEGAALASRDLVESPCAPATASALAFDTRTGLTHATREIDAGEIVGRVGGFREPAIVKGQTLNIETRVGPVRIERRVTALQTAAEGEPFFVKGANGEVLVAPATAPATDSATDTEAHP